MTREELIDAIEGYSGTLASLNWDTIATMDLWRLYQAVRQPDPLLTNDNVAPNRLYRWVNDFASQDVQRDDGMISVHKYALHVLCCELVGYNRIFRAIR